MKYNPQSIRTFIGAKNYQVSRDFYTQLGFTETPLGPKMSYFQVSETLGFYLQDAYVKNWINNSMVFLEVEDVDVCQEEIMGKKLQDVFKGVRFTDIKVEDWGREFFMHDPSGVLWHFGEFNKIK